MVFQPRALTAILTKFLNYRTTRSVNLHTHHQADSFALSTPQIPSKSNFDPLKINPTNQSSKLFLDESFVLNQLSEIIPSIQNNPILANTCNKQFDVVSADSFLPPEDKFRGVFLQKCYGRAAFLKALDDVGLELNVELDVDLVAKVVDKGNLKGEFIVMFLDWAIQRGVRGERIDLYNVVLKALGRRKFYKHMVDLLDDMRDRGVVKGNADSLFIVVDSFLKGNQISKALEMFGRLEEFGFELNVELLNRMLLCLCHRGKVAAVRRFIRKMRREVDFDGTTYNILIGRWARSGAVAEVERFLQEMVEDGYVPDCLTYAYILEGLGRAGKVDDSVKVFQHLVESGNSLNVGVYNAMISNFISVGNIDESLNYYRQMLSDKYEPDMDTYSRLITTLLKVKRVADSLEMFDQMLDRGIVPTTGLVTTFLQPLCSYGPPNAALMMYKKARISGCRISPTGYKLLLFSLSMYGKCGPLLSLWKEMQESGHSPDMEVYEYIINGFCNVGHIENASLVLEGAIKEGYFPSKEICAKLYKKLLAANRVERAYKLVLKMRGVRARERAQKQWRAKGWHF